MNKKALLKLIVIAAAAILLVRFCSSTLGSMITLPGGMGGNSTDTGDSGGWFSPKNSDNSSQSSTGDQSVEDMVREIEREMKIGKEKNSTGNSSSSNWPETPASATAPLTFKGIPITGSLQEFGTKLVNAGFRNAGNGVYIGDFAGYRQCKVTPVGSNPVYEVRVDFPVISDWDSLEKSYDSLQASLTQKYGIEPTVSSGSNVATYNLPGGAITLDADVKDKASWHVILKYSNRTEANPSGSLGMNPIDDL